MRRGSKKSGQTQSSLAQLEEFYFSEGAEAAQAAFRHYLPKGAGRPYSLIKPDQGFPAHRTDIEAKDGITYESFSPPGFWEVPYVVLKVRFDYVPKEDFIYHGGEEILVPIKGEVNYHFYNTEGHEPPQHHKTKALKPGSFIVLNPQIPHHTWGGRSGAEAWMVIRHVSDSASAITISMNSHVAAAELHPTPRRISREDLEQPGIYALVAWGIAEKIRLHRDRAKCRIGQLAKICGVDPSHLSRIENASANVSIEILIKIARVLRIGLHDLIAPAQWSYIVGAMQTASGGGRQARHAPLLSQPEAVPHLLHANYWEVPADAPLVRLSGKSMHLPAPTWSWIVLKGRAIFDIEEDEGKVNPELLEEGSVIHFLRPLPTKIQALQDSQFLQITYSSGECACTPAADEK
jgi:transcriptional regulator with XRE-family HTH domain